MYFGAAALENANDGLLQYKPGDPCSFVDLFESCIRADAYIESVIDQLVYGKSNYIMEAGETDKKKFDGKGFFKTALDKIGKMFSDFVGAIKKLVTDFIDKINKWYENHSISKGLLKIALHGKTYEKCMEDCKEAAEKYGLKLSDIDFLVLSSNISELNIDNYKNCTNRIYGKGYDGALNDLYHKAESISSKTSVTEAQEESERVIKEANEFKKEFSKKVSDFDAVLKDFNIDRDKYYGSKGKKYDAICYYFNETSLDKFTKSEFDTLVKFVEDSKKRANTTKKHEDSSQKYCKEKIERLKKNLKDYEKMSKNKSFSGGNSYWVDNSNRTGSNESKDLFYYKINSYELRAVVAVFSADLQTYTLATKSFLKTNFFLTSTALGILGAFANMKPLLKIADKHSMISKETETDNKESNDNVDDFED